MEGRLGISSGEQDIRFNLMAVVPDRRIALTHKLNMLRTNKNIVTAALEKLTTAQMPQPSGSVFVKKELDDDGKGDGIKKEPSDTSNISILQRLSLHGEVFPKNVPMSATGAPFERIAFTFVVLFAE